MMNEYIIENKKHATGLFRKLYHVSDKNMDGKILSPRVPVNSLTKKGLEEGVTARVCFAPSIDRCLMALSQNLEGKELYVHVPSEKTSFFDVKNTQVPDSKVTKEKWVVCNVKIKCIGKIKVISAQDKPYKFDYPGHKDMAASWTYKWNWEWVDKYTKESVSDLKLTILESWYNKEITTEECDDLLYTLENSDKNDFTVKEIHDYAYNPNIVTKIMRQCKKDKGAVRAEIDKYDDMIEYARRQIPDAKDKRSMKEIISSAHNNGMRGAVAGATLGKYGAHSSMSYCKPQPITKNEWNDIVKNLNKNKDKLVLYLNHLK